MTFFFNLHCNLKVQQFSILGMSVKLFNMKIVNVCMYQLRVPKNYIYTWKNMVTLV